ncbi:MAG: diguanylate cyclase [Armatimonadetes bacterium]|nr:diguanylate cyclase [Armatimonadota bacterium]
MRVDSLTGLPEKAALEQQLREAVGRNEKAVLALLDIDGFARLNTELGTEVGDRVLRELAGVLREEAGATAYRVSADEFALLLPGLSLEQGFLRMEALRARVSQEGERFGLPEGKELTLSVGVTQSERDGKTAGEIQNAAYVALLTAKENGGNQVALPPNEQMVMKSCYYPATLLRSLKALSERRQTTESALLREALNDLLRKHEPKGNRWQRFTDRAKRTVFFAREAAMDLGDNWITPEHLLLGLMRELDSVANRVLLRTGVPPERIRAEMERQVPRGPGGTTQDFTLDPRSRKVLNLADAEAKRMDQNHIGTEHLLMGLIEVGGLASEVLADLGLTADGVRREIAAYLQGEPAPPPAGQPASDGEEKAGGKDAGG